MLAEDWSALVKHGEPPAEAIKEAGFNLYSDYCKKIGGAAMVTMIERSGAIISLAGRIDRMGLMLPIIASVRDERLFAELEADGFKAEAKKLRESTGEAYQRVVQRLYSMLKADNLALDRLVKEQPKGKVISREDLDDDFEKTIISIAENLSIKVDENADTMFRYCGYVNRLRQKIESMNRAAMAGRNTQPHG